MQINIIAQIEGLPKCGQDFGDNRKYRVVVKLSNGHRVSKVPDSLKVARKLERKLKDEAAEKKLFMITKAPVVDDIWLVSGSKG